MVRGGPKPTTQQHFRRPLRWRNYVVGAPSCCGVETGDQTALTLTPSGVEEAVSESRAADVVSPCPGQRWLSAPLQAPVESG